MSFVFGVAQLFCWVGVGYEIALNNTWKAVSFGLSAFVCAFLNVMNMMAKEIRKHGTSN
jgi:hypothetical protein